MIICINERHIDTAEFDMAPEVSAVFDRLRSEKLDTTGIPGLGDILGLEVATLDPVRHNWLRNPWYLCTAPGKEYKNPKWAVDKFNQICNVVNGARLSGIVDRAVETYISKEFPQAELVTIYDLSKFPRQPRRYIYDMGDSKLYMVLDVRLAGRDHTDVNYSDKRAFIARTVPILDCFLYKDSYPDEHTWSRKDAYYRVDGFNFSKNMDSLKKYIDDVYTEKPRRYRYSIFSPLSRGSELVEYGDSLERKLRNWAKGAGVRIDNIIQRTDSDDDYVDTFFIDTYNTHYDSIAKFLKDEKEKAPGWVDYGISGLH